MLLNSPNLSQYFSLNKFERILCLLFSSLLFLISCHFVITKCPILFVLCKEKLDVDNWLGLKGWHIYRRYYTVAWTCKCWIIVYHLLVLVQFFGKRISNLQHLFFLPYRDSWKYKSIYCIFIIKIHADIMFDHSLFYGHHTIHSISKTVTLPLFHRLCSW